MRFATGDLIPYLDAGLEIPAEELIKLYRELVESGELVAVGSRFLPNYSHRNAYYYGNKLVTFVSNVVNHTRATDLETAAIMIDADLLRSLHMRGRKWDFSIELAAKLGAQRDPGQGGVRPLRAAEGRNGQKTQMV